MSARRMNSPNDSKPSANQDIRYALSARLTASTRDASSHGRSCRTRKARPTVNRSEQTDKALKDILKDVECARANKQCDIDYFLSSIEKCAKAALASPPRNCDVGDADAQAKRFGDECDKGHICSECPVRKVKTKMAIEFNKGASCEFIWSQMPYTESEAKG